MRNSPPQAHEDIKYEDDMVEPPAKRMKDLDGNALPVPNSNFHNVDAEAPDFQGNLDLTAIQFPFEFGSVTLSPVHPSQSEGAEMADIGSPPMSPFVTLELTSIDQALDTAATQDATPIAFDWGFEALADGEIATPLSPFVTLDNISALDAEYDIMTGGLNTYGSMSTTLTPPTIQTNTQQNSIQAQAVQAAAQAQAIRLRHQAQSAAAPNTTTTTTTSSASTPTSQGGTPLQSPNGHVPGFAPSPTARVDHAAIALAGLGTQEAKAQVAAGNRNQAAALAQLQLLQQQQLANSQKGGRTRSSGRGRKGDSGSVGSTPATTTLSVNPYTGAKEIVVRSALQAAVASAQAMPTKPGGTKRKRGDSSSQSKSSRKSAEGEDEAEVRRRYNHNMIEKRRREEAKIVLADLKDAVRPLHDAPKPSKTEIMQGAANYIRSLEAKITILEMETVAYRKGHTPPDSTGQNVGEYQQLLIALGIDV